MAGNLFDENSAQSPRDPLRWCKSGMHQTKVINKATGEKFCIVCKKTITGGDHASRDQDQT